MKRQRGFSSPALVLLLLLLGSLLLQGVNQRQRSFAARVATESRAIRSQAWVQSALEWGRMQRWKTQPALQCRRHQTQPWHVCLRVFADYSTLLIAQSDEMRLWRSGEIMAGRVVFSTHGWSDFCPLKETRLCLIP